MMNQLKAKLRVCACCEWIFIQEPGNTGCPKCGFATYGARFVFGNKCYRYALTQQPWFKRRMDEYASNLQTEILKTNKIKPKEKILMHQFLDVSRD
jgi:hypothetical protein